MNINQSLWKAIEEAPMIRLRCKDKERIVEPHDYGIHNGKTVLLAFRWLAPAVTLCLPAWRWMKVDMISDIEILNRTFSGGRPAPSARHHKWDEVFVRVKPARE